jgi:sulfofructose kinase
MDWTTHRFNLPGSADFPFQVAGMGLNAVDQIVIVDRYPERGGKLPIRESHVLPGGQVATAMVACRVLGLSRVRYIGKVGDDGYGEIARRALEISGVDCRCLFIERDTANQSAVIVVDNASGERTIFWQRPDQLNFRPGELDKAAVCSAPVLHLDGHDEDAAIWCARAAKAAGFVTVLDIDRVRPRTRELLPLIDFCLSSESFPHDLTGQAGLESALHGVARICPGFVGATLGARGVVFLWADRSVIVPGYAVECKDTTGAGDVFHGAFIYGLVQGWPLGQILLFANAAAALNCTALGARGGLRSSAEVLAFMAAKLIAKEQNH